MRILITQNTDYRIENDVCTAVRPHNEGGWKTRHPAVGQKLMGAIKMGAGFAFGKIPQIGMRLVFSNDLMTSPLIAIA